jgi:hypothetical protein
MKKMDKAGFWDALSEKYPEEFASFADWVDEYKRRNKWDRLFNERAMRPGMGHMIVKYHDLPNAMQLGIFIQYTIETGSYPFHVDDELIMQDWEDAVEKWFEAEHNANNALKL